ncbi:hypothetical protein [Capnocytophaga granulosa]|jgi:hypothetical protein|uniref:capsular polysaccharide export protein, LipB/KpsS family n=1 Tax=Capnocytophaga granulosa TaxID=45242 RepID=UPI0028D825F5|nr:hypothetical protein [Capnocytophaga granulosa]
MKILFFFTAHPRLDMIIKIQAELLMTHILNKDKIYIVNDFNSNIAKSQINYNSTKSNLYYYKSMFENLITTFQNKGGDITILEYKHTKKFQHQSFNNIQELKNYKYQEYGLGMSTASTMISLMRDHKLDTISLSHKIDRELRNSIDVLTTIDYYNTEISPELVYVFNGRMSVYAPIILYCKKNYINFKTFEFSLSFDKYHLLSNEIPHNIICRKKEIIDLWADTTKPINEKREKGTAFFENQRGGISTVEQSYIGLQNKEFDSKLLQGKEVVTFFNSSIDEFAAVPGWEDYIYLFEDETKAIEEICLHYINDDSKIFILRIHPNLKFIDNTQNRELLKLKTLKNLIIIEAHSPIRSYSLLDASDKIITFGSTIGVEACYYGKPVICLGLSFYEHLDVSYIPKTKEELYSYIDNKNLQAKPKENALPYGYWFNSFGEPYTNFLNKEIKEEDYQLRPKQKQIGILLKITDINNYKRILKVFNPKKNIVKKLKDPSFKKNLFREFAPWKIK